MALIIQLHRGHPAARKFLERKKQEYEARLSKRANMNTQVKLSLVVELLKTGKIETVKFYPVVLKDNPSLSVEKYEEFCQIVQDYVDNLGFNLEQIRKPLD